VTANFVDTMTFDELVDACFDHGLRTISARIGFFGIRRDCAVVFDIEDSTPWPCVTLEYETLWSRIWDKTRKVTLTGKKFNQARAFANSEQVMLAQPDPDEAQVRFATDAMSRFGPI
jgi:hypothetical protein